MRSNRSKYDDILDGMQRTAKSLVFTLGVIKAAELVFKKRFL